jgi:SAM-dependent methyltransferase
MHDLRERYQRVPYEDFVSPLTDPGLSGTIAQLYGIPAVSADGCRILELGCGAGLNLSAIAAHYPASHCVGMDLVPERIAEGRQRAERAGLSNLELLQADLSDFSWRGERFDRIIVWGLFSWVPDALKARIFEIVAASLAPAGVACICFLTYPGCKLNEGLRDLMTLQSGDGSPQQRLATARAALTALAEAGAMGALHHPSIQAWRQQAGALLGKSDALLFHDELGSDYDPCYLLQFVDWAAEHGLVHLADADTPGGAEHLLPPDMAARVTAWSGDALARDQFADYLTHRTLRTALLVRAEDAATAAFTPAAIRDLSLGSLLQPLAEAGRFRHPRGEDVTVTDADVATLLRNAAAGQGLRRPTREWLDADDTAWAHIGTTLFDLFARKLVTLSQTADAVRSPERPALHAFNRLLLDERAMLVSGQHQPMPLPAAEAAFLGRLTGSLSRDELLQCAEAQRLGAGRSQALLDALWRQGSLG